MDKVANRRLYGSQTFQKSRTYWIKRLEEDLNQITCLGILFTYDMYDGIFREIHFSVLALIFRLARDSQYTISQLADWQTGKLADSFTFPKLLQAKVHISTKLDILQTTFDISS